MTVALMLGYARSLLQRVVTIIIPVPLIVMIGVAVWWRLDRSSYARQMVAELVAGAELEAERAKLRSAQLVADELRRQRDSLQSATAAFESDIDRMRSAQSEAEREIRELQSRSVSVSCTVDRDLIERLRSR